MTPSQDPRNSWVTVFWCVLGAIAFYYFGMYGMITGLKWR